MIVLNKRIADVDKPHWMDNTPLMGHGLNSTIIDSKRLGRHIQKITIEVDKPTQIYYVILPGRWIDRLYDCGFLMRGTL